MPKFFIFNFLWIFLKTFFEFLKFWNFYICWEEFAMRSFWLRNLMDLAIIRRVLCSSSYHNITISYQHDITRRNGISRFWSKIYQKHKVYHFYPFIKARNEKINELQTITFRDLSATRAETGLAPPKRAKRQKKNSKFFKNVF